MAMAAHGSVNHRMPGPACPINSLKFGALEATIPALHRAKRPTCPLLPLVLAPAAGMRAKLEKAKHSLDQLPIDRSVQNGPPAEMRVLVPCRGGPC